MNQKELNEYLEFAKELAFEAGKIMKRYFLAEEIGLEIKADNTPVTLADTQINELVITKVKAQFPDHGIIGEEGSFNQSSDNLWIVDPLDGTQNFAEQIPFFAFSIALVSRGQLKVAVVYDPIANRLLSAADGQGAHEAEKRLYISQQPDMILKIDSWITGGIENSIFDDPMLEGKIEKMWNSLKNTHNIRISDLPIAYAIALIASGDLDAVVSSIKTPWDVAAGSLIAREAGAKVTDLLGRPTGSWEKDANGILIAAPAVHNMLLQVISPVLRTAK